MYPTFLLPLDGKLHDGKNQLFTVSPSKSLGMSEKVVAKPGFGEFSVHKTKGEKEQMALVFSR